MYIFERKGGGISAAASPVVINSVDPTAEPVEFNGVLTEDLSKYGRIVSGIPVVDEDAKARDWVARRKAAYAPIEEQMAMYYDDAMNGTTTLIDSQAKVKNDIPKYEDWLNQQPRQP